MPAHSAPAPVSPPLSPPLSPGDRLLLRDSFELALERDDDFPRLFYDILFHRHPEIAALFGDGGRGQHSLDAQRLMFGQTLMAIVDHLDDRDWLEATLVPMGTSHVRYGVTRIMYDQVADALFAAFVEVCGADWTPEHDRAWRTGYGHIVAIMLKGAE